MAAAASGGGAENNRLHAQAAGAANSALCWRSPVIQPVQAHLLAHVSNQHPGESQQRPGVPHLPPQRKARALFHHEVTSLTF